MKRLLLVLGIALLSASVACGGGGGNSSQPVNNPPSVSSIQVSGLTASILTGQTQQLKATATYSDGTTKDVTSTATWSTTDGTVATIGASGMLTAKASGQCSAVAKVGTVTGSLAVVVTTALISVAITPANPSIAAGTQQQFIATGTYSDNSTQNLTSKVTWASSNTSVATISTTSPTMGLTSAVSAGTTTISATLGSISGSTVLTVTSATVTQIAVTPANGNLTLGLTQQYTAIGTFSDSTTQDITNVVQWKSSNGSIASITVSGLATGSALGTVTISAAFGGITGSTSLTVNAANVSSISITPANGSIAQGTQQGFKATGTYNDGSTHDLTRTVVWSTDNPAALTIGSTNGVGIGIAPGPANVSATLGSISATVPFTVTNATIVSIAIAPTGQSIPTGGWTTFSAVATFSDSSTQNITARAAWSSDNTAVATVGTTSPNYGVSKGVSAGTANISASFSYAGASAAGSAQMTVTSATLSSITMSPNSVAMAPGSSAGIAAYGTFSDGTKQWINPLCTWTSSSNSVATVSPNGLVMGQSAGTVTITAQDGSIIGTASALVESAQLSSIQVTPASKSVPVGFWFPFAATGTFANGDTQNLTSFVNWTSSQPAFATISNAASTFGEATGVQPGTTTIGAVYSGLSGQATLTVTSATLTSITVMPSSASIALGAGQAFTATGQFSDGSSMDVTRQVNWSSSNTSIATINSAGGAQSVSSGTITVSASANGVSGTATLTVQ